MIEQYQKQSAQEEAHRSGNPRPHTPAIASYLNRGDEQRPHGCGNHDSGSKAKDDGVGALRDIVLEEIHHSRTGCGGKEDEGEADEGEHGHGNDE